MDRPNRLKIAVTGAHGVGKTTLLARTVDRLSDGRFYLAAEVPRRIAGSAGQPRMFQREESTFGRQCLLLAYQLDAEAGANTAETAVILCDRTVVDHWSYTTTLFPAESSSLEGQLWERLVRRWLPTYDLIVGLRPEFALPGDQMREADASFQEAIDTRLFELYTSYGVEPTVLSGSVNQRTEALERLIAATLGESR